MTNKSIINQANKILTSLQKLQAKARKIVDDNVARNYIPPHISQLLDTLDDLANFDLEDAIVNAIYFEY